MRFTTVLLTLWYKVKKTGLKFHCYGGGTGEGKGWNLATFYSLDRFPTQ